MAVMDHDLVVRSRWSRHGLELTAGLLLAVELLRSHLAALFASGRPAEWSTVFVSVTLQALPFLTLGVVASGFIAAFVSPRAIERALPRNPVMAVPVAGLAGMALPGCECSSVPIAGRLVGSGVAPAAALTFLLAAPAINPIVLVATAVAFPGHPEIVVARFVASLACSVVVGWLWLRIGGQDLLQSRLRTHSGEQSRVEILRSTAVHDFVHAGGYLVVGAAAAATLEVFVPTSVLDHVARSGILAALAMGGLAVVLAVCSEADAFVAASLTQFSLTARLVFLVVGPAVDLKLVAMQLGTFGRRFTTRFAPLVFCVAVIVALVVGGLVL